MASAQPGTFEECFNRTVAGHQPRRGKPENLPERKFRGITASTTPSGWKMT
jgi:hypothetical protein